MGDMTYEHPQNVTLSQIIVANEGIVQASQAQPPPDSSEEEAEVRHQQFFFTVMSALPAAVPSGTTHTSLKRGQEHPCCTSCRAGLADAGILKVISIGCWPCNAHPHSVCCFCRGVGQQA